jgi:iron complex transport system permease protein
VQSFAPGRRELAVFGLVGAGLLVTWAWGLSVRLPEEADFAWKLAVNGPRLLLAAVVGAGLAVSGVVAQAGGTASRREVYTLAVSFGMAFGATRGLTVGIFGSEVDTVLGAAGGAIVFLGVVAALARARQAAGGLVGIAMFAMGVAAALAAVDAKGDPLGARPVVWWMLGDFSRAQWPGASLAAVAILSLSAAILWVAPPGRMGWELEARQRRVLAMGGAVLWGVAIGAGGIIAWFGMLSALAARRLLAPETLRSWLALSALLGALGMLALEAGGRALIGGYAFPVGLAVAMIAVPWFLAWGRLGVVPRSRTAARLLRGADFVLAGGAAAVVVAFVVVLTVVVRALG